MTLSNFLFSDIIVFISSEDVIRSGLGDGSSLGLEVIDVFKLGLKY